MARVPNQNTKPGGPAKPPGLSKVVAREWDRSSVSWRIQHPRCECSRTAHCASGDHHSLST